MEKESNESKECCGICGDLMKTKYSCTLKCNHVFHYECIQKTLLSQKVSINRCPYCRQPIDYLEPVNGLKKLVIGIHYRDTKNAPKHTNTKCDHIMTRGKRKGESCNNNCKLGYLKCGLHQK